MKLRHDEAKFTVSVLDKFNAFLESLSPYDESTGVFYQVLSALIASTKDNYLVLQRSLDIANQPHAAWSCRNLLEIRIITRYVLSSEANLNKFAEDRLLDGLELTKSLKELHVLIDSCFDVATLDDVIAEYESRIVSEKIERRKYLRIECLAKESHLLDEYQLINKICSKLVHPTAWSLMTSYTAATRFPEASILFDRLGSSQLAEIVLQMKGHVERYGLRHKPL